MCVSWWLSWLSSRRLLRLTAVPLQRRPHQFTMSVLIIYWLSCPADRPIEFAALSDDVISQCVCVQRRHSLPSPFSFAGRPDVMFCQSINNNPTKKNIVGVVLSRCVLKLQRCVLLLTASWPKQTKPAVLKINHFIYVLVFGRLLFVYYYSCYYFVVFLL